MSRLGNRIDIGLRLVSEAGDLELRHEPQQKSLAKRLCGIRLHGDTA